MTNRPLADRARTLEAEINGLFAQPSKRTIRHTEAMDVLARCDGHRNRQAATAAEAQGADDGTATDHAPVPAPQKPNAELDNWRLPLATLAPHTGYVGLDTNGAPPEAIDGFFIEGEIDYVPARTLPHGPHIEAYITEHYWLKARCLRASACTTSRRFEEFFAFAAGWRHVARLANAIIQTQLGVRCPDMAGIEVDGYQNEAQINHDEEATDVAWENLRAEATPHRDGFMLRLIRKATKVAGSKTIASLCGRFDDAGLHAFARDLGEMEAWATQRRNHCEMLMRQDAQKQYGPPPPPTRQTDAGRG